MSNKRKSEEENRAIQESWKNVYFIANVKDRATCLICTTHMICKDYNVRRHYSSKHATEYDKYTGLLREEKIKKLENVLKKQQSVFTHINKVTDVAVKASYMVAHEIALSSKPFVDGEFIKKCLLMVVSEICPEKKNAFENISLSRNTVADRIDDLSENLNSQLKNKVLQFVAFSIAIDESTDISDTTQLAIFIRGVDENLEIIEEFVKIVSLKDTTTGEDIFNSLVGALNDLGVDWDKAVSLATDGAPAMVGRKVGVAIRLKEKLRSLNPNHKFCNIHCILHQEALCSKTLKMEHVMDVVLKTVNLIRAKGLNHRQFNGILEDFGISHGLPYHTDVRWLSRGTVLKRFYELREEIKLFMDMKGHTISQLEDNQWLQDLAFMVDITNHLSWLNLKMQGRNHLVIDLYDCIRTFMTKLKLWEKQFEQKNLAHFPTLKSLSNNAHVNFDKYNNHLSLLSDAFRKRFMDFKTHEKDFQIFRDPFSVNVDDVPEELQMEIIELQSNQTLKNKFDNVGIDFYKYFGSDYPKIKCLASKIMSMFGTTYVCEQFFSMMTINKTKLRSRLTDNHLNSTLKIATAQSFSPEIDELVKSKRCQSSWRK